MFMYMIFLQQDKIKSKKLYDVFINLGEFMKISQKQPIRLS